MWQYRKSELILSKVRVLLEYFTVRGEINQTKKLVQVEVEICQIVTS